MRNANLTREKITNVQRHNEREKESYVNQDIVPERTPMNIHFKSPTAGYTEIFDRMEAEKTISTRGLKADANLFGELIFDVNSAYFHNHGGYDYARQFYEEAYRAAAEIVGGEQYILSAVMHADERNRAMSEALGQDVYHYHLHVVYIPVVEKQVLWTKRCKDPALVGTVKETIMQVSSSKKWKSRPALDEQGNPLLQKNGKPVLRKSYSILQDDFYEHMRKAGYTDIERGERGSGEEHLTVTQFKVAMETERLETVRAERGAVESEITDLKEQREAEKDKLRKTAEKIERQQDALDRIDEIEAKLLPLTSKVALEREDYESLKNAAKGYVSQERKESKLKKLLDAAQETIRKLTEELDRVKRELAELKSVRAKLRENSLAIENEDLRKRLRQDEAVIERHGLWNLFGRRAPRESRTADQVKS